MPEVKEAPFVLRGLSDDFSTARAPQSIEQSHSGDLESFEMGLQARATVDPLITEIPRMAPANAAQTIRLMAENDPESALTAVVALLEKVAGRDSVSEHVAITSMHAGAVALDSMQSHEMPVHQSIIDTLSELVMKIDERVTGGIAALPLVPEFMSQLGVTQKQLEDNRLVAPNPPD